MKFTGIVLILMGMLLFLVGGVTYTQADTPTGELARVFPLNPTFTFVMAAGSLIAGVLMVRYGGRGFSQTAPG
ncbi:MAG: hypothetical protein ABGY75_21110 [Gemmataceae bacterium]